MHRTETHLCEISHCGKPAPSTTICHDCVEEVHRALYQFLNVELDRLKAIALGEEQTAEKIARQNSDPSAPQDVLDLSTLKLHQDITTTWPQLLDGLASHPNAERLYWRIIAGCELAQAKINGDTERFTQADLDQANKQLAQPMRTKDLIEWLWDTFRIRVTHMQIRHWAARGKIQPATGEGKQHKTYRPKDILEAL
ncbi:MAG TPA: hypothetical protein VIG71_10730 [Enteractinococcus sp.]